MALGDLSPNQQRYRDRIVAGTGLDSRVVTAWIGTESGWGTAKASHNYLNIGPGRTYSSVDQAANAAVSLITSSTHYAGIRSAIPAGPVAQVKAIGASPWGTSASLLARVYEQLAGTPMTTVTGESMPLTNVGLRVPFTGVEIPMPWDIANDAAKAMYAAVARLLGPAFELMAETGLRLVFTVAALGLVALGLNRLTGVAVREAFDQTQTIVGRAGQARAVAAR